MCVGGQRRGRLGELYWTPTATAGACPLERPLPLDPGSVHKNTVILVDDCAVPLWGLGVLGTYSLTAQATSLF